MEIESTELTGIQKDRTWRHDDSGEHAGEHAGVEELCIGQFVFGMLLLQFLAQTEAEEADRIDRCYAGDRCGHALVQTAYALSSDGLLNAVPGALVQRTLAGQNFWHGLQTHFDRVQRMSGDHQAGTAEAAGQQVLERTSSLFFGHFRFAFVRF